MRNVVLNHISSIGCCNPLGQTNPMLDSTTMLENGNFGFPYSFLPRFPLLPSGATISTSAISTRTTPFIFDAPAFSTPAFSVAPFFHRLLIFFIDLSANSTMNERGLFPPPVFSHADNNCDTTVIIRKKGVAVWRRFLQVLTNP